MPLIQKTERAGITNDTLLLDAHNLKVTECVQKTNEVFTDQLDLV